MSSYNRNVNNTASKVTNVAGAAAGASTGKRRCRIIEKVEIEKHKIMEFKSLKSIESSFRQIRLFTLVFLGICASLTTYAI